MFLTSKRIPPGSYALAPWEDDGIRIKDSPLRPGIVSPEYYPAGFSPFEGEHVSRGPVKGRSEGIVAESLKDGAWWNWSLLSLARAEYPDIVWRTLYLDRLDACAAFGIVGREVVAIVAPLGKEPNE